MDNIFDFFDLFLVIFIGLFSVAFFAIFVAVIRTISRANKNEKFPQLSTEATVVTKRTDVSSNKTNSIDMSTYASDTTYYVTFEFPSTDRMEFQISDNEFGMMVEGDRGTLTFKGTRYISFSRF